jgi:hypothetical protein
VAKYSVGWNQRALLTWTQLSGGVWSVQEATVSRGVIGERHRLSDAATNTILSAADVTAAGQAVVLGTENVAGADGIGGKSEQLVAWPATALYKPFGAREQIGVAGVSLPILGAAVAVDPLSTRVVAAWSPLAGDQRMFTSVRSQITTP